MLQKEAELVGYAKLAKELGIGEPTLKDMIRELSKPGRDPRDELPPPLLRTDVVEMDDLVPGMELKGTGSQRDRFQAHLWSWRTPGRSGAYQPNGPAPGESPQRNRSRGRRCDRMGA